MAEEKEKVLNLPMRQKYALEILRGEKVREYRPFTDHWAKIIGKFDDPKDKNLMTDVKQFDRVHFYPYNNKWFLDCKVKAIIWHVIDDEFFERFKGEYDGKKGDVVFIIRLDGVIATNLKA